MAKQRDNFEFSDPWFDPFYDQYVAENINEESGYSGEYDEPEEGSYEDYYREEPISESYLSSSNMQKRRELFQKHQQQVAEFYQAINNLPGSSLKGKFSLFLSLALIQQFDKATLSSLRKSIAEGQPNEIAKLLKSFYEQHQWNTPFDGASASEQFQLLPTYLNQPQKFQLEKFGQALSQLVQHYDNPQSHQTLYKDLTEFTRKHQDEFSLFDLQFNFKRFMYHILDEFGYKAGDIVHDGCAGIGLLTHEMLYPRNETPTLQLETSDPLLAQIGQQLMLIQSGGKPIHNITFKENNPLNGSSSYPPSSADFYISFPKMPYNLNDKERQPTHAFSCIRYNGTIARYASDGLWVQYALHCLKPTGMAFLLVQDGFLRRSGYDSAVRKYLVENGLIEAVVSLHRDHARQSQYNQVSLLILNKEASNKEVDFFYLRDLSSDLGLNYDLNGTCVGKDEIGEPSFMEPKNFATFLFYDDESQRNIERNYQCGTISFIKGSQEIAENDYNLSFEYYLGQQRSTDYPILSEVEKSFEDAKDNMFSSLKTFEEAL